jgi:uncharacterized protein (TIGR02594 family)
MSNFVGYEGFVWFIGVVEDVDDPLQLGRARVRINNVHSSSRTILPTDKLPWATPVQSIASAAVLEKGLSPTGLLTGSTVVGFFADGQSAQHPLIFGTFAGNQSFPDNDSKHDVNKLARGVSKLPKTPDGDISEPSNPFAAKYPYNLVYESQAGHIVEIDDTPGKERIHIYHKTGTWVEMHPNGDKSVRVVGNDYEVVAGNQGIKIGGNALMKVVGNLDINVGGRTSIVSGGNMTLVAPKIDLNPPSTGFSGVNPVFVDTPVNFVTNIQPILPSDVPEGHPTNPEQIEPADTVYIPQSKGDGTQVNPFDIAASLLDLGNDTWKETGSNPSIAALWDEIGYKGSTYADQTAWCAVFTGAVLKRSGNKYLKTASSQAYKGYGREVDIAQVKRGDLVVFYRKGLNSGFGHVGFATGAKSATHIQILGGNQGNTLSVRSFKLIDEKKGWGIRSIRRAVAASDGTTLAPDAQRTEPYTSSGVGGGVT